MAARTHPDVVYVINAPGQFNYGDNKFTVKKTKKIDFLGADRGHDMKDKRPGSMFLFAGAVISRSENNVQSHHFLRTLDTGHLSMQQRVECLRKIPTTKCWKTNKGSHISVQNKTL